MRATLVADGRSRRQRLRRLERPRKRFAPRASVSFPSGATLAAGSEHERLSANRGSGLEQVDGAENARHDQVWVSAAQQFGSLTVRGRIGQSRTSDSDSTAYAIGADLAQGDGLRLSFERNSGFFVVSPRTIGLGLRQVSHRAGFEWGAWYQLANRGGCLAAVAFGRQRPMGVHRGAASRRRPDGAVEPGSRVHGHPTAHHHQLRQRLLRPEPLPVLRIHGLPILEGWREHRPGPVARPGCATRRLQPRSAPAATPPPKPPSGSTAGGR